MDFFLDDLELCPGKSVSLREQLLVALRSRILDGRFNSDEQMPTSRELAKHLGISRKTVIDVFETLLADGMIFAQQGTHQV